MVPGLKNVFTKIKRGRNRIRSLGLDVLESVGPEHRSIKYKGFRAHYTRGTTIVRRIQLHGVYEPELTHAIIREIRTLGVTSMLDIGANIGLMTLNVLHACPEVRIHAFEPGPHQAGLFKQTIETNALADRVQLYSAALSNDIGEVSFCVHDTKHSSGDGLRDTGRAGKTEIVKVPSTTLDAWWEVKGRPHIPLGKLDTEGSELWILQGGKEFLKSCKPVLFIELCKANLRVFPYSALDVLEWVESNDMILTSTAGVRLTTTNLDEVLESTQDCVVRPRG